MFHLFVRFYTSSIFANFNISPDLNHALWLVMFCKTRLGSISDRRLLDVQNSSNPPKKTPAFSPRFFRCRHNFIESAQGETLCSIVKLMCFIMNVDN